MFQQSPDLTLSPVPFPQRHTALRRVITGLLVGASANLGGAMVALAQPANVEEVLIRESSQGRYMLESSSIGKFTESLLDTPQSMTMISAQLMDDRSVMNLDDALRNVPGITLGAGEFSWQGNNPTIRGFSSRNDMFLDGMRDLGSYVRDPFNVESLEVLLGPASMVFGRGSTGGVINQSSKKPLPTELRRLNVNVGNASTLRATADLNQPLDIGENTAVRLNLLAHKAEVPGRDRAENERYGFAPSLSTELGDATLLTLGWMHLESESVPDYGFPWVAGEPARVDRENHYGFDNDFLETDADVLSVQLDHRLNEAWTLNAQLRHADYSRSSRITEPQVAANVGRDDDPAGVTVHRMIFSGESEEQMQQAQLNLRGDFVTGRIEHALVSGVELAREKSRPAYGFASQTPFFDYGIPVPTTSLGNPGGGDYTGPTARRLQAHGRGDTTAAYVLDTLRFGEQWRLSLGLRWDEFETRYLETRYDVAGNLTDTASYPSRDSEFSYRAGLVYKPVPEGSIYLGWGTSFNPSAEDVSFVNSGRGLTTGNVNLDPEENENLELGVKWSLLQDRLMVDAAVFRVTKDNARVADPQNPGFNTLAGRQEVRGYSVNLSGGFGDVLHFTTGFTHLDDEQRNTITGSRGRMDNVARNTFSFWLDMAFGDRIDAGIGTRYVDRRVVGGTKWVDDYWALDAMLRYEYSDHVTYKLNLTNLTDEVYFDQLHPWHVVPGPAFGAVFAVNLNY